MHYDVFNGDADGIIALLQLRLSSPKQSQLVTGVKRDISLLKQVDVEQASSVTVLDISLEKNLLPLKELLAKDIPVIYIDHHRSGDIPQSDHLTSIINTDPNTCTSLLVNDYLKAKYVNWAIAAAFGDNMIASAKSLANKHGLTEEKQALLCELGTYINYNGYGRDLDDLYYSPSDLFNILLDYPDPFSLIEEQGSAFSQLKKRYHADMSNAQAAKVLADEINVKAVLLADESWARRISGVFGNELANQSPDKAHAVLTLNSDNSYTVSLRAPLNNKQGAGDICAQFPTGGGRAAAAGINALPKQMLGEFFDTVAKYYQQK